MQILPWTPPMALNQMMTSQDPPGQHFDKKWLSIKFNK